MKTNGLPSRLQRSLYLTPTCMQTGLQAIKFRCEMRTPFGRPVVPDEYRRQPVVSCISFCEAMRCHSSIGPSGSRTSVRSATLNSFQRFGVRLSMRSTRSSGIPHCFAASTVRSSNSSEQSSSLASASSTCLTSSPTVKAVEAPLKTPPAATVL